MPVEKPTIQDSAARNIAVKEGRLKNYLEALDKLRDKGLIINPNYTITHPFERSGTFIKHHPLRSMNRPSRVDTGD